MILSAGLTATVIVIGASLLALDRAYSQTLPPRVTVGSIHMGGLSRVEATNALQDANARLEAQGLRFQYQSDTATIPFTVSSTDDPDLTYPIVTIDTEATIDTLWSTYHHDQRWAQLWQTLQTAFLGGSVSVSLTLNQTQLQQTLADRFAAIDNPAVDSQFVVTTDGQVTVTDESSGHVLNYTQAISQAQLELEGFNSPAIELELVADEPSVSRTEAQALLPARVAALNQAPVTLTWEDHEWTFDRTAIQSWFQPARGTDNQVHLAIDPEALAASLKTDVTSFIDVEPADGKFSLTNGRVKEFQGNRIGRLTNISATSAAIITALEQTTNRVALVVDTAEPATAVGDLNNLGIKELIGVGRSNMKGSPVNRRHNVAVGAEAINGLLIPPGETFSLVNALEPVDGEHGYRQELVIKDNQTIPEFGGGLCQVGTTTFRAAMASGLPVVERQNHSYVVRYYFDENGKPGTDATIYGPHPDLRFVNDTGHHILIQTHIDGDELAFEFWGTRDGRVASQTSPVVSNHIAPPPPKLIETTDLPIGVKKCTEKAHTGLTSRFTYSVAYPDGRVVDEEFVSKYKPWQEVCLIGVDPAKLTPPTETPTNTNSATPANANSNANQNTNTESTNTNGANEIS